MDGWASPLMRVVLPVARDAAQARVRIEVPAWAGYKFPLRVTSTANGARRVHELARAGTHDLECGFAGGAESLDLRIESDQSTDVPGTGAASFRLQSISAQ
jgi:hypothetical protein